jgi:hypothetical protein
MTIETSTAEPVDAELLPGYFLDRETGAWLTLPWPGDRALPWVDPSRLALLPLSIGPQMVFWAQRWLLDYWRNRPWRFHPAQGRFHHLWYALRDDGRWLYRSSVRRGAKGSGKDPFGAAYALGELCGPARFTGEYAKGGERAEWDHDYIYRPGEPIAVPHRLALVQIGANSEAQAKDLLRVANAMVSRAMRDEYAITPGVLQTTTDGGSRMELLTRSEASSEGDPATAIVLNETHHMTSSSGGQALAGVARRNVAKSPDGEARLVELTNAHQPGEGSVAEDSYDAWQVQVSGRGHRLDILYDSREAPPHLSLHVEEQLEAGIRASYRDSPWVNQERMRDEAQDPRTPLAASIRFYFNSLPTNEDAWVDPRKYDSLARPEIIVADKEPVALFLDCSKSSDATVFAGTRISDGHVIALGGWQRPHGDRGTGWLAPRPTVDAEVRRAFDRWQVCWIGVDPSPARDDETEALYWAELIDAWHRDFRDRVLVWATPGHNGNAVRFDMRLSQPGGAERVRAFTEEAERTAAAIDEDASLTHDGDAMMRLHVHNARRRPNPWGISLGKQSRSSSKLVDYAVGMVGARLGRRLVLNSGKLATKKRSGKVW